MKPTLRQLEYFIAVAETGTFGDAARRANVSQPSLSVQIRDMEAQLGTTLFERGRQGALLTPIGERLVPQARTIIREAQELRRLAQDDGQRLSGRLRLGVLPSVGPYLLPPALRTLHTAYPALRIAVYEERALDLLAHLQDGQLDLIITAREGATDMAYYHIVTERLYACVAPDDPLGKSDTLLLPRDLKGRTLLSLGRNHRLTRQVSELARDWGAAVSTDYEGTSLDAIRAMAAMGDSVAILPSLYAVSEAKSDPGLVVRPIKSDAATRKIALLWRRTSPQHSDYKEMGQHFARTADSIRV